MVEQEGKEAAARRVCWGWEGGEGEGEGEGEAGRSEAAARRSAMAMARAVRGGFWNLEGLALALGRLIHWAPLARLRLSDWVRGRANPGRPTEERRVAGSRTSSRFNFFFFV